MTRRIRKDAPVGAQFFSIKDGLEYFKQDEHGNVYQWVAEGVWRFAPWAKDLELHELEMRSGAMRIFWLAYAAVVLLVIYYFS